MNPLLDFTGLPRFEEIKPELVEPAIDQLLSVRGSLPAIGLSNPNMSNLR